MPSPCIVCRTWHETAKCPRSALIARINELTRENAELRSTGRTSLVAGLDLELADTEM